MPPPLHPSSPMPSPPPKHSRFHFLVALPCLSLVEFSRSQVFILSGMFGCYVFLLAECLAFTPFSLECLDFPPYGKFRPPRLRVERIHSTLAFSIRGINLWLWGTNDPSSAQDRLRPPLRPVLSINSCILTERSQLCQNRRDISSGS